MLGNIISKLYGKNYLLLIFILALVLRFILPDSPPSLNWDEVSHGYNAYSVLKTGKDEWGKTFPLLFRAYGDYKLPLYIYLTAISEMIFGLNTYSVRFVSLLAGAGSVLFTYLFTAELFRNNKNKTLIAGISAFLMAIEPWSFFLSRGAFEANLALFFFITGAYFFVKFINNKTIFKNFYLFLIMMGLTVWTYNSYRVYTPLLLFSAFFIYRKDIFIPASSTRALKICIFIIVLFFLPMFIQLFTSVGQARYSRVQILDEGTITRINEARGKGGSRLIHNKATYFLFNFGANYFKHFSPQFLFLKGGSNYQFSIPDRGILSIINMPFFYLGIIFLLGKYFKENNFRYFLLAGILLAPIPSSLTREAPHVLRAITLLPFPMLLTSIALVKIIEYSGKNLRRLLLISYLILASVIAEEYLINYFGTYKYQYSQVWQYGYKEASEFASDNYGNYEKIIVTKKYGEPHEFFLFYLHYPPEKYFSGAGLNRFYQTNWYWVDGFDKFYFVNDWQIRDREKEGGFILESKKFVDCKGIRCLLITSPDNHPKNWSKLGTIKFLDNSTAFEIFEN